MYTCVDMCGDACEATCCSCVCACDVVKNSVGSRLFLNLKSDRSIKGMEQENPSTDSAHTGTDLHCSLLLLFLSLGINVLLECFSQ